MPIDKKCPSCGGTLLFAPGTDGLSCQLCGYTEKIPELISEVRAQELDLSAAQSLGSHDWGMETQVCQCSQCGGLTINNKLQLSGLCPFCGSTSVVPVQTSSEILAPNGIIPFKVNETCATNYFKNWARDLFLAPEKLSQDAKLDKFKGLYVPYFTFDVDTVNEYFGKFTFKTDKKDSEGNIVYERRNKSGAFQYRVNDFPVVASNVMASDRILVSAMQYNTEEARVYTPDALAGFPAEHYSVGLAEAWNRAANDMNHYLKEIARIYEHAEFQVSTTIVTKSFTNVTYKYLLVPVWVNSFVYDNRRFMIVVNGQTGVVRGQWPKSFGRFMKGALGLFF